MYSKIKNKDEKRIIWNNAIILKPYEILTVLDSALTIFSLQYVLRALTKQQRSKHQFSPCFYLRKFAFPCKRREKTCKESAAWGPRKSALKIKLVSDGTLSNDDIPL